MYFNRTTDFEWQLISSDMGYAPTRVFGNGGYIHDVSSSAYPPPDEYRETHRFWFGLWDEASGVYEISVFYPMSAADGDRIDVVVDCPFCGVTVKRWTAGETELAWDIWHDGHKEGWCSLNPIFHQAPHDPDAEMVQWYDDLIGKMVEHGADADDISYATEIRNEYAARTSAA